MVVPMIVVILFFAMTAAAVVLFARRRRTASTSSDDNSDKKKKKKRVHQQQRHKQQQAAKASFRVQKSHLMSISGRGVRRKHKDGRGHHQQKTRRFRMNREDLITGGHNKKWYHQTSSWYEKLRLFFVNIVLRLLSIITFGYWQPLENENNASSSTSSSYTQSSSSSIMKTTSTNKRSNNNNKDTLPEGYYDNITVVGLDCEMVGGGKFGMKSLLARCSVVTLDCIPSSSSSSSSSSSVGNQQQKKLTSLNENLVVLYDKYVIPKEKVTDYRTEFSGISKSTYTTTTTTTTTIPIVSFQTCQNEISNLFASISNKPVLIVGHALQNDFDALEISHPISLIRDTAFFVPYMRRVGNRKLYSRKLSVLSSEELGIDIQQPQSQQQQQQQQLVNDDPPLLEEESGTNGSSSSSSSSSGKAMSSIQNESKIGHSSVEDAAAALRLYWHRCREWEQSLNYPLRRSCDGNNNKNNINNGSECCWTPLNMYLDGCNLPVAMRGVDFKELFANPPENLINNDNNHITMPDKPRLFSITSRKRDNANNVHTIDWMPVFLSALSPNAIPKLDSVSVLFDGAKYRDLLKSGNINKGQHGPRIFCCEGNSSVIAEITKDGESVDDVLFERLCCSSASGTILSDSNNLLQKIIPLSEAIDILSLDSSSMINSTLQTNDNLSHYVVIRRKGGGSKTHRRLFDKLNLRRPNEGALCLSGITNKLQRNSWKLARDLQRERGAEKVIECELRRRQDLRYIVVTNDVYLTERLMKSHAVMVLSFMQFSNMF